LNTSRPCQSRKAASGLCSGRWGGPGGLAVVAQQRLLKVGVAVGLVGDEQGALGVQREGAQVVRLVVQHAQGQPVPLPVGAARLVPADVRRAQPDGLRPPPWVFLPCRAGAGPFISRPAAASSGQFGNQIDFTPAQR
jgi:hypothetical protein